MSLRILGGENMANKKHLIADIFFTAATVWVVFLVNLQLVRHLGTKTMTPMIFVLGVFLVSWRTQAMSGVFSPAWSVCCR